MFAQFREQYPQGSIVTDMLPKADGMHVFRATVRHGDTILATATATDRELETAEDRAIERALTVAGFSYNSRLTTTAVLSSARYETRLETRPDRYELPSSRSSLGLTNGKTLDPLPDVYPLDDDREPILFSPSPPAEPSTPALANGDRDLPPAPLRRDPEPLPEMEPTTATAAPVPPAGDRASAPKRKSAAPSPTPEPSSEPVDLSEYIAQIGVEMERLGWNTKRGRDYLMATFGKKARAELTEGEMQQFLAYLKAQP